MQSLKDARLANKFIIAYGGIIFFSICVIAVFTYKVAEDLLNQHTNRAFIEAIKQVNLNIGYKVDKAERIINYFSGNNDVQAMFCENTYNETADFIEFYAQLSKKISSYIIYDDEICRMKIFLDTDRFVFDKENVFRMSDFKESLFTDWSYSNGNNSFSWSKVYNIKENDASEKIITVAKVFRNVSNTRPIGIITLDLYASKLFDSVNAIRLQTLGNAFVMDSKMNVLYQQNEGSELKAKCIDYFSKNKAKESGSFTIDRPDRKSLVVFNQSGKKDWFAILEITQDLVGSSSKGIRKLVILISSVCILLSMFIAYLVTRFFTSRISRFTNIISKVAEGDFDIPIYMDSKDEIGKMISAFNIMKSKIKFLIDEVYVTTMKKQEFEVKAIQAQINPHFLCNTLSSINWMLMGKDVESVSKALMTMADYYRLTLNNGRDIIRISDEIEQTKAYIDIQKLRFYDKLKTVFFIADSIHNYYVTKIILQPFVENAILHGVVNKKGMGTVIIRGEDCENTIKFHVIDDGIGMPAERIRHIMEDNNDNARYGIFHVNKKIKHYYGSDFGVEFFSRPGIGTVATITIPKIKHVGRDDRC